MVESRGGWTRLSSSGGPIRDTSRSIVSLKDDESSFDISVIGLSSSELLLRRLPDDEVERPSKWNADGRRIRLFRDPPPTSRAAAVPPPSDASSSIRKAK